MINIGLLFMTFFFILISVLSCAALFAVAMPIRRGLEFLFVKKFPWRKKVYIATLSTLIMTATGTYAARLFVVVGERLRFAGHDPFPGDIEVLLVTTFVNTMFILIAVGVAAFRLRKIFVTTDELESRGNFDIISILLVLTLFNFTQTMLTANNLIS